MASNITLYSGSPLMGSPVIVHVTAGSYSNVSLHRVVVKVTVSILSTGIEEDYKFTLPVSTEGSMLEVDISSALRSAVDGYSYVAHTSAGTKTYPIATAHIEAYDEYMRNGIAYQSGTIQIQGTYKFIFGAWTDRERMSSGLTRGVTSLTRKPAVGEVVPSDGSLYAYAPVYSYSENSWSSQGTPSAPTSLSVAISSLDVDSVNVVAGRYVYVSSDVDHCYEFQFVNGYGVIESAFAYCLSERSVSKEVKEYAVSVPMAFNKINRFVTRKLNSRHALKMSTGPVTVEWLDWWLEEFLNTHQAWMYDGGSWVPVSIVPDDKTDSLDLSSDKLPEVTFTVKIDLVGG